MTRKPIEESDFYLQLVDQEKWSCRQFEGQFKLTLFERPAAQPPKVSAALRQAHPEAASAFKDAYMLEFLIELGRDFCFVGSEFPAQAGAISVAHSVPKVRETGPHGEPRTQS